MIYQQNRPQPSSRLWASLTTIGWTVLAIALLAALIFVRQAEAVAPPAQAPVASAFEDEEFEGEEEAEGEEGEEEEFEEEEEDDEVGAAGPLLLPPECLLHTAEANVAASSSRGSVRLTIHYTAYEPADVSVDYWLKGSKGALHLGASKRHFTRQGVFREEAHLNERAMAKVLAARAFIVQLDIAAAPSFCNRYSTQRLTARHGAGGHATWSRPR
jgi:hypothetical protein